MKHAYMHAHYHGRLPVPQRQRVTGSSSATLLLTGAKVVGLGVKGAAAKVTAGTGPAAAGKCSRGSLRGEGKVHITYLGLRQCSGLPAD